MLELEYELGSLRRYRAESLVSWVPDYWAWRSGGEGWLFKHGNSKTIRCETFEECEREMDLRERRFRRAAHSMGIS